VSRPGNVPPILKSDLCKEDRECSDCGHLGLIGGPAEQDVQMAQGLRKIMAGILTNKTGGELEGGSSKGEGGG